MTIYLLSPDNNKPVGGIKQLYRHVDILNRNGFPASILHDKAGFRCDWFENQTRVSYVADVLAGRREDDILVLPEIYGTGLLAMARGARKVVFNQNCYYTLRRQPVDQPAPRTFYEDPEVVAALVVSEDSEAYLRYVFPRLNVVRIRYGIDPARFHEPPAKKRQIAFMLNKNLYDVEQVVNILKLRGNTRDYAFAIISDKTEQEAAALLRESEIFLSFGNREGFSLPPAEAMACGCVAVGYHGGGGREYFLPEFSYPVQDGDVIGFVRAVEEVIELRDRDPERFRSLGRAAAAHIRAAYSLEREEEGIVAFWRGLLAAPR